MKNKFFGYLIQILSLAFLFFLIYENTFLIHKYCPFALVCNGCISLSKFYFIDYFIIGMIFGIIVLVSSIFFGRLFSNWICPIGFLQDLTNIITKKNLHINSKLYSVKYVILLIAIVGTLLSQTFSFSRICPPFNLFNIGYAPVTFATYGLIIIFLLSFFYHRIWCRIFCPFSALIIITQNIFIKTLKISPKFQAKLHKNICTSSCKGCSKNCLKWE